MLLNVDTLKNVSVPDSYILRSVTNTVILYMLGHVSILKLFQKY